MALSERFCPNCGREQPETSSSPRCIYCGSESVPPAPAEESVARPSEPTEAPTAAPPGEEPLPEGKRRCPACGELLYETEARCWRCGHEFEQPEEPAAEPAPPAPLPPVEPVAPVPVAPATPPASAAPPSPVVTPPVAPAPPVVAAPPVALEPSAQSQGIWALVLGLLGLVCCPIVASIIAIVLGVKAKAKGVSALGIAGIVLGILGLVIYIPLTVLGIIGAYLGESETAPEATSWLLWWLSC